MHWLPSAMGAGRRPGAILHVPSNWGSFCAPMTVHLSARRVHIAVDFVSVRNAAPADSSTARLLPILRLLLRDAGTPNPPNGRTA